MSELPELPPDPAGTCVIDCGPDAATGGRVERCEDGYSADQMTAYARRAVAAEREQNERAGLEIEALRAMLSHTREQNERLFKVLGGIFQLLSPKDTTHDGKVYRFVNPNANETLIELSRRIEAIPDEIAAIRKETT